jgi:hypothetical protein
MKTSAKFLISGLILSSFFIGCDKTKTENDDISYLSINKEFVLIRNVDLLKNSDDEISNHVDSILKGEINSEIISTGQKNVLLFGDGDLPPDIGFEIINLNNFNVNKVPSSFDSLAARVIPMQVEVLDNSTYKYPDALNYNDEISENGNWTTETAVLGTFLNAGNFQGYGEKYLAIRAKADKGYKYGWLKLYCSKHNDTLKIIDFAVNNTINNKIKAGQTN